MVFPKNHVLHFSFSCQCLYLHVFVYVCVCVCVCPVLRECEGSEKPMDEIGTLLVEPDPFGEFIMISGDACEISIRRALQTYHQNLDTNPDTARRLALIPSAGAYDLTSTARLFIRGQKKVTADTTVHGSGVGSSFVVVTRQERELPQTRG